MGRVWRYDPSVNGPKYLVRRRDGTVPEWPWFVLGARDKAAPWALRAYAFASLLATFDFRYSRDVWRLAAEFAAYRRNAGPGDPNAPRHRADDPATVEALGVQPR